MLCPSVYARSHLPVSETNEQLEDGHLSVAGCFSFFDRNLIVSSSDSNLGFLALRRSNDSCLCMLRVLWSLLFPFFEIMTDVLIEFLVFE